MEPINTEWVESMISPVRLLRQLMGTILRRKGDEKLEPVVGIEPTTVRLQIGCSTAELNWHPKREALYTTISPAGQIVCEWILTELPESRFLASRLENQFL